MKFSASLRWQFLGKMLAILLVISIIAGVTQISMMKSQINEEVKSQGEFISNSILQKIEETDRAAKAIEYQIDLKLLSYSQSISDQLKGQDIDQISQKTLLQIKDDLGIAGITIMKRQGDDIVGVQSTNENEIGFSFKKIGYPDGYKALDALMKDEILNQDFVNTYTYVTNNFIGLPISQSGSHEDTPTYFKYGYYYDGHSDYIVNPYITANEVYQFTEKVGPESWISELVETDQLIEEIAVLNRAVFADSSLETKLYPPMKKVEYGTFEMQTEEDVEQLIKKKTKQDHVHTINGNKIYKMFLPVNENQVVYVALDYEKLIAPLYRHGTLLIGSGILSLLALFLLTARFFNEIYENIQRIKAQINLLESGNLTTKSNVTDNSELQKLSESANRMVDTLHRVINDTSTQAQKVQRMSVMVEAEASQSVEKMFTLSTETTLRSREQLEDIIDFLGQLTEYLQSQPNDERQKAILEGIDEMRKVAKSRTEATTDITLYLSDLLKSLHNQSSELSDIANLVLQHMATFKLSKS